MKKFLTSLLAIVFLASAPVLVWGGGIDLNLHLEVPNPPKIVGELPLFLGPPAAGFEIAVGVPYGLFHVGREYFACKEGTWYRGVDPRGPWAVIRPGLLPPGLARRPVADLLALRDREYRRYRADRRHYRGKVYRHYEREADHDRGRHRGHHRQERD